MVCRKKNKQGAWAFFIFIWETPAVTWVSSPDDVAAPRAQTHEDTDQERRI